ncbi:hypothetical protein GQ42DRAFT_103974, partial [Ramicandelaber brevisporus]
YQRECEKFSNTIMFLLNTFISQPARATEIATITLRNGATQPRSLYIVGNRVAIVLRYSKTQNIRQKQTFIVKILPAGLSRLLVAYIACIRPVETQIAV